MEGSCNALIFATEPTYGLEVATAAYHWIKKKHYIVEADGDIFIAASGHKEVTKDVVQKQNVNYRSFATMTSNYFSHYKITFDNLNWKKSLCTCAFYQKQYHCKHIFGLAVVKGIISLPPAARDVPVGQKRKRGRPAGAKKALLRQ